MSKQIKYIDAHGHINFPEFSADRQEVIARAAEAGVGIVTVGTDVESSQQAVELALAHENMWAIIGIHPTEVAESFESKVESKEKCDSGLPTRDFRLERSDFQDLRRMALHPKAVAIGECGLDYFHSSDADIAAQIEAFERHIAIANEARKPLMLHVRNGKKKGDAGFVGRDAYKDALHILQKSAKVPFDFHFFAGSMEDMREIFAQGGMVSFTGVLTFTHDYDELVRAAPLDRLLSETDCPYVAPVPHRGKRNEPAHVIEVIKAIARIRGEDEESVRAALLDNARRFFSI